MQLELEEIKKAAETLETAKSILFITGAGVSADSGLPTYRGAGGLYNDKLTEDGIPVEMALAGETLQNQPDITWKYLKQIEQRCRGAKYNRAHKIIAEMEESFERVCVFTQNIDGFHNAAGSSNVIDIHGNMYNLYCARCGWRLKVSDYSRIQIPPKCLECNNIVRPDVVFFGEMLDQEKLRKLFYEFNKGFDVCFSIGTTSVFPYIKEPILMAKKLNKFTVEINPDETEISKVVDVKISLGATQALEKIWAQYLGN